MECTHVTQFEPIYNTCYTPLHIIHEQIQSLYNLYPKFSLIGEERKGLVKIYAINPDLSIYFEYSGYADNDIHECYAKFADADKTADSSLLSDIKILTLW